MLVIKELLKMVRVDAILNQGFVQPRQLRLAMNVLSRVKLSIICNSPDKAVV